MLAKDDAEHPVPPEWRTVFHRIADAFASKDYELRHHDIAEVSVIDRSTADFISKCVVAYGDSLAPLNMSSWKRSIYYWRGDGWMFLVDLTTLREEVSDLTLYAKLHDTVGAQLEVVSVHVP